MTHDGMRVWPTSDLTELVLTGVALFGIDDPAADAIAVQR